MKKIYSIAAAMILSVSFCDASLAAETQESFSKRFVSAVNSHDKAKLKELIYPKSLECLKNENEIILTQDLDKFSAMTIPDQYKANIRENPAGSAPMWTSMFKDKFDYPLIPTHQFQIDWVTDSSSSHIGSMSVIREVALTNDVWVIVLPCPRPGTVEWLAEVKAKAMIENQKNEAAAEKLVQDLKDPAKARILNLLEQNERFKASKILTEEFKVSTTISMKALDLMQPADTKKMEVAELVKLADAGQAAAQYELAVRYFDGKGVEKDLAKCVELLKKAVAQDHVNSQLFLGTLYEAGNGVPRDPKEAAALYLKAAKKESSQAQFNLGWLYESGSGVEKNLSTAYMWYSLSGVKSAVTAITKKMTPAEIEAGDTAYKQWTQK